MSYINRYTTLTCMLLLLVVSSCKKDDYSDNEKGYVEFAVDISDRLNVQISKESELTKSTVSVPDSKIEFYSGDDLVYTFNHPDDTSENVAIDKGDYNIKAYSIAENSNQANFDIKKYAWSGSISVSPYLTNSLNFTMTLSVAMVTVGFSDDFINAVGSDNVSVTVSNGSSGILEFTADTQESAGYFDPANGEFTYTIKVVRTNGTEYSATYSQTLSAADYLSLVLDLGDEVVQDDDAFFNIKINQDLNEVKTDISIDLESGSTPPTYSATFDLFDVNEYSTVETSTQDYTCTFDSEYGLSRLYFNGEADLFAEYGLNRTSDLLNLTTSQSSSFSSAGITITNTTASDGSTSTTVDFTSFIKTLTPGDNGEYSYPFILTAVDKNMNISEVTFTIKVVGTRVILEEVYSTPTSYETATTANLVISAKWLSSELPSSTALLYRTKGTTDWTVVKYGEYTVDSSSKTISHSAVVAQNSTYECKLAEIEDDGTIEEYDSVIEQEIVNNYSVPNLNFDSWHSDGDTYYPNASDGNSYWATGNEGVTMWIIGEDSNTQPETSKVVSGKAARMFTYTGILYADVAAGSIYTGTYATNISDPSSSVSFGRDFSGGRPKAMTGYFMYSSGGDVDGSPDKCNIYIKLLSNGSTVGFGELLTDRTVTSYEKFTIDIDYTSDATVDEIAIVATSSYLGADFKGASDSQLYIDEFELRY